MKAIIELIKTKVSYINNSSNDMIGCPDWNKLKSLIKKHQKENEIYEISLIEFQKLYGLNEKYNKSMILEINRDLFN